MGLQIFGKSKCFDTKKAQRYFKERGIVFQFVDLSKKEMSRGELTKTAAAVGGIEQLIDYSSKEQDAVLIRYLASEDAKLQKLIDNPMLIKTPVVRMGRLATVGYRPEIWAEWEITG